MHHSVIHTRLWRLVCIIALLIRDYGGWFALQCSLYGFMRLVGNVIRMSRV